MTCVTVSQSLHCYFSWVIQSEVWDYMVGHSSWERGITVAFPFLSSGLCHYFLFPQGTLRSLSPTGKTGTPKQECGQCSVSACSFTLRLSIRVCLSLFCLCRVHAAPRLSDQLIPAGWLGWASRVMVASARGCFSVATN